MCIKTVCFTIIKTGSYGWQGFQDDIGSDKQIQPTEGNLSTKDNYFCWEKISSSHRNLPPLFRTIHSIKKTGYWVKFVNIDVNVSFSSSSQGTFTKNGSSKWRRDIIPKTAMMRVATYYLLPSANISMSNNFVNGTFSLITCQIFITYLVGITNYSTLFISTPLKGKMFLVVSM